MIAALFATVVVELFTSQGCSSCPPAEAMISVLAKNRGQVIPLAYHVDYWDRLGWRDPFSSADWTRRQMFYVRAFRLNSAYTPQMVINGSRQFVPNSVSMNAALDEASRKQPQGTIAFELKRNGSKIEAAVRAEAPAQTDVVLVVFEDGVTTKIERGENGGRTLTNDAIVRRLVRVGSGSLTKSVDLDVDPSWKRLGVVVFLQDRATLAITNATVRYL